jgi:23S rRNA (cytidine1920-2'-O)/16S rRNA (cytidine1409-2'-O)-methyltransferase
MARKGRPRFCALIDLVTEKHREEDAFALINDGAVAVDGRVVTNPRSLVRADASVTFHGERTRPLRGEAKLEAALRMSAVSVNGRVALDLGAAAGGFTRALLTAGAARVYAVDAGHGQLLGSLRQDPRVINLERTNLGDLSRKLVSDVVELVTADLSYVALADAIPQLNDRVSLANGADLLALVKPQFELALAQPPAGDETLGAAVERASRGIERAGWTVMRTEESPIGGRGGSTEFLLHARRWSVDLVATRFP